MKENAVENVRVGPQSDLDMVHLLVRNPEENLKDLDRLKIKAKSGIEWVDLLTKMAQQTGKSRGFICRLLVPFDVNTNANDQAQTSSVFDELVSLGIRSDDIQYLSEGAINLRKLLRVKLADDSDILQALDASYIIMDALSNTHT